MSTRTARTEKVGLQIASVLLIMFLGLVLSVDGTTQRSPKRQIACKSPQNTATCYWAHGRLAVYNGTPSYRLWKIGTHRILGISSGPNAEQRDALDNEHPEFPANVERAFKTPFSRIFADFEICPLEPEHAGWMQSACIESAKNIVVDK